MPQCQNTASPKPVSVKPVPVTFSAHDPTAVMPLNAAVVVSGPVTSKPCHASLCAKLAKLALTPDSSCRITSLIVALEGTSKAASEPFQLPRPTLLKGTGTGLG